MAATAPWSPRTTGRRPLGTGSSRSSRSNTWRLIVTVASGCSAGAVAETVTPAPSLAVRYHVSGGAPVISWAIVKSCPRVQVGWIA